MLCFCIESNWTDITEMQNKIEEVLNKVGMKDFGKKMPHQLLEENNNGWLTCFAERSRINPC
jgi:ABC-type Fe3+/spermidine/putrescine transport system ATPase subunit